jgi:hypothetical protein
MSNQNSDKLFRLVKAMTMSEKRYFIVWAQAENDRGARYMQLFDGYDRQKTLNDDKLVSKIYPGESANGSKYAALKAYLFDQILKGLQAFDENSSVDFELRHLIQSVAVLFRRGLYLECWELLTKGRRIAIRHENFPTLLEILRWEKHLAYTLGDVDLLAREIQRIDYEEDTCLKQLDNLAKYRRLFLRFWTSVKTEAAARHQVRLEKLHRLADDSLLKNVDEAFSHRARVLFFRSKTIYHYLTIEHLEFYETSVQLISLQESKPWFLKESLAEYIAALSNFWLACGLLKKYDEVATTLEKLRSLKPITRDDRVKIQRQYFSGIFNLCVFTGNFEQGKLEIARLEAEMDETDRPFFSSASFQFIFFSIAFGCADFERAIDFINHLLSAPKSVARQDLQSLARILNLIVHFEIGNLEHVDSLLRSSSRYLRSKNRLFKLEKTFIEFMGALTRAATKEEQKQLFLKEKQAISAHSKTQVGQILMQYFDLESWLDSKISENTFAEVVRAKLQK